MDVKESSFPHVTYYSVSESGNETVASFTDRDHGTRPQKARDNIRLSSYESE